MHVDQAWVWGGSGETKSEPGSGCLRVGPGTWRVQRASRVSGRAGRTWQQLEALGLGAEPVPLALPAPLGAEYVPGGGLGVFSHAEGLAGGLRGTVTGAVKLRGADVGSLVATFLGLWEQRRPGAGGTPRGSQTPGIGCHRGRREDGTETEAAAMAPRS